MMLANPHESAKTAISAERGDDIPAESVGGLVLRLMRPNPNDDEGDAWGDEA